MTYKVPCGVFGLIHHLVCAVEHGANGSMIAATLDRVLPNHVYHLLVPFDDGDVVFEDLEIEGVSHDQCCMPNVMAVPLAMGCGAQGEGPCQSIVVDLL